MIEGHAGVGKTEVAKVMSRMLETNLIRLQCYEGLDASPALYEWNYPKQLLHIKLEEPRRALLRREGARRSSPSRSCSSGRCCRRSRRSASPVLLVDEVDRADEEFEAFMLEVLSDWQVTIPEIGTIKATHPPHVILTSNRTRELSRRAPAPLPLPLDRLSRGFDKEIAIVARKVPGINERAGPRDRALHGDAAPRRLEQGARAWPRRSTGRRRWPSLHADHLDEALVSETLGCVLKDADDMKRFRAEVAKARL